MNKFIIVILIIAIIYMLVLYFRCKRLDKITEQHEKKLHDAAIIISAHKTVLINKTIKYTKDTRDVRIINRELDEEIAECCKGMTGHDDVSIILTAHKLVLINKVIKLTNDTRDINIINRELEEEISECYAYMIEHEEELIKKVNEEHIVRIDKEDK
jgi:hypothetical protein